MQYICNFLNPDTDERKTVTGALSAEEVRSVQSLTEHADMHAMAYALRHAYAEVPKGFLHTEPPELIRLS
jgi:hypothetical protein